jgi:hypothetical protein
MIVQEPQRQPVSTIDTFRCPSLAPNFAFSAPTPLLSSSIICIAGRACLGLPGGLLLPVV